jgi:hypothetical protein
LVFTAISTLTVLLVVGLVGWLPRRPAGVVITVLSGFLFLVSAAAPFLWIKPAYAAATYTASAPAALEPVAITFENDGEPLLRLVGYHIETLGADTVLRPGDQVDIYLEWRTLAEMEEAWSVFVHLNDPVLNTPIAQRDMYPGQGTLSTRFLEPGDQILNRYRLHLPSTAVAPADLELMVGLYRYETGQRLQTDSGDAVSLAALELAPIPGTVSNPTSVNLGNELELVGYDLRPRQVQAGETIDLTLYWQARKPLSVDYTFFAQILNNQDTTRWAGADIPADTASWPVGQVQEVTFPLPLNEEAPAGVYPLIIGVYTRTEAGDFQHLQPVEDGRITLETHVPLTKIRVNE